MDTSIALRRILFFAVVRSTDFYCLLQDTVDIRLSVYIALRMYAMLNFGIAFYRATICARTLRFSRIDSSNKQHTYIMFAFVVTFFLFFQSRTFNLISPFAYALYGSRLVYPHILYL